MSESNAPQRAVASEVSFNIGLMSAKFDIIPARRPKVGKDVEIHYICPEHDDPTRVSIQYVCDADHVHKESELARAYFGEDDTIVPLADEDVTRLRCGTFEEKNLDLHVHPVAEIESLTAPDEALYRVRPPRKAGQKMHELYALLLAMASDPKHALVGELRFRDGRKLYRLRTFRGQLTLQSLVHPQDLAAVDEIEVATLSKPLLAEAKRHLEAEAQPFDPAIYGVDTDTELKAILAVREEAPLAAVVPINAETSDLMAKLKESVEAQRGKKIATPSHTARKTTARTKKQPAAKAPAKRTTKAG